MMSPSIKSWLLRLGAGALTLTCLMSPGGAATLNIDFGGSGDSVVPDNIYSGVGAAPDSGTFWNGVGPFGSTLLYYSNGTLATGVSVTTDFTRQYSNASSGGSPLLYDRLIPTIDYPDPTSLDPHTVTLSGLKPGGVYDVYAYAGYYSETFSAPNAGSAKATGAGYSVIDPTLWVAGIQYALLSGAIASGAGTLVLTVEANSLFTQFGESTTIAGLQVAAVPLPAALPLFAGGLGVMGWLARRKRRLGEAT